jgi:hypothetical protein
MLQLGTSDDCIAAAETKLGVVFPNTLREFYRLSNGIEIPPDWRVYSVFNPSNPRKSAINIVHENTTERWSYMSSELICLAGNGTGNQLVLKKSGQTLEEQIYVWDHETNKIRKWSKDLGYLAAAARKRVATTEKLMQKGKRKAEARPKKCEM